MQTIRQITDEREVNVGMILMCIYICDTIKSDAKVGDNCLIYRVFSKPYPYQKGDSGINGHLCFNSKYIWPDKTESNIDFHFLNDMGITLTPYNDNRSYIIKEELIPTIREMTFQQFVKMVESNLN